jgi:hypothetical protein
MTRLDQRGAAGIAFHGRGFMDYAVDRGVGISVLSL